MNNEGVKLMKHDLKRTATAVFVLGALSAIFLPAPPAFAQDRRGVIYELALELEQLAAGLAESSFQNFRGRSDEITDQEQAVLFKSEAFSSTVRLFLRLTEERAGYFGTGFLRTNLYNAFLYIIQSFQELETEMRQIGLMPYALNDGRKILDRMDREFGRWPAADNLAYLHQKYVKAADDSVYLIERRGTGRYVRRAFKNLESIYKYNYDANRGADPWKYLVSVEESTLRKMEEDSMIARTFEGAMIIEQSKRSNRPVFRIENGKKRGVANPQVVERLGGWKRVFEVPAEVIEAYPEGEILR
jgi:hypothetical protein